MCALHVHVHLYVQVCMPVTNEVHCWTSNCLLHLVFANLHILPERQRQDDSGINDEETLGVYLRLRAPPQEKNKQKTVILLYNK